MSKLTREGYSKKENSKKENSRKDDSKKGAYGILFMVAVVVLVNYIAANFYYKIDLTEDNRFTLSKSTKTLLVSLEEPVDIIVYLDGQLPAGFKKLSNTTRDLLREFKTYGRAQIRFKFESVSDLDSDAAKQQLADSLFKLGLSPTNVKAQIKKGEGQEERLVFPGAVIQYKNRAVAIDFLQGLNAYGGLETLNKAESLLEYKFASAIEKIRRDRIPAIAYATGNGQPFDYTIATLSDLISNDYFMDTLNIPELPWIPDEIAILMVVKPTIAFTEEDKLKIDQFIMRGGKMIWMVDKLYAEFDSLQRKQADFVAFDRNLQLDDLFFKYGVRINPDLVQDLQSEQIPMVIGSMGGKPQIQPLPFPYFVKLKGNPHHAISKNLDNVLSYFPSSIDTVAAPGIRKTILLTGSLNGRTLETPAIVSINSVKNAADQESFIRQNIPIGVLLEGSFTSLYKNRLGLKELDTLKKIGRDYLPEAAQPSEILVVADGDLVLNHISQDHGPLPMGATPFSTYQYANGTFLLNVIDNMVSSSGVFQTRSKDYTLRLLDPKKVENDKTFWQITTIIIPLLILGLLLAVFQWWRKQKYS